MNDTKQSIQAEDPSRESEVYPGWVKGPDGWEYTYPDGKPRPPANPDQTYVWITDGDDRVCPVCAPLHGALHGESWTLFPPVHPNCRCSVVLIPKPE